MTCGFVAAGAVCWFRTSERCVSRHRIAAAGHRQGCSGTLRHVETLALVITAVLAGHLVVGGPAPRRSRAGPAGSARLGTARRRGQFAFVPRSSVQPWGDPTADRRGQVGLRKQLTEQGLDAGAFTIGLAPDHTRHHGVPSHDYRILGPPAPLPGPVQAPRMRHRFEAEQPNARDQVRLHHYFDRLIDAAMDLIGTDVEIPTLPDDRPATPSAHRPRRVTGPISPPLKRQSSCRARLPGFHADRQRDVLPLPSGRQRRPTGLEHELSERASPGRNGQPNHPQTQGKVERSQQTCRPRPADPAQDAHRTPPPRPSPASPPPTCTGPCRNTPPPRPYASPPKAAPSSYSTDTHDRVRRGQDRQGQGVTSCALCRPAHQGHELHAAGTCVILLYPEPSAPTVVIAATGEILRDLIIDPRKIISLTDDHLASAAGLNLQIGRPIPDVRETSHEYVI